ncbi:MAG: DUF6895 family protein, partial [Nitrososphaera sp.]
GFYHEIIQHILDQGYTTAVEDVPFRVMDLRHMLDSGGFKHNFPSYDHLYQQTLLAKTPPLLYLTDADVYSITHTLFYLADFGFRPIEAIPGEQLPTVCWIIGALLGIYLRSSNWDLVGELLLACRCLRWPPPFVFDTAWDALLDAQLPDGSIPGPEFLKEEMQKLNELERRTYCFEKNYHTTLVSALACFLSAEWITNRCPGHGIAMRDRMTTCLPPSAEQVSLLAFRARTWLQGLSELTCSDTRIPMTSILQIFVGLWICEKALGTDTGKSVAQSLACEVQRRLDLEEQDASSALLRCDAALVLLSAGILRVFDSKSTTMELFIQKVAFSIQVHEDQDQTEAAELFATRFILHNLHLHPEPGTYRVNSPRITSGMNLFQADESVIRLVTANIAAATAYGQKPPSVEPELLEQLAIALSVWMLYYLRQYNLEVGTLLLRTMNYLHLREVAAFQTGLNFVIAQQQPDGRFGFLAPEASHIRSIKPDLDEILDLYLPLTVSCLWAIAEATDPDFILVSSPRSQL